MRLIDAGAVESRMHKLYVQPRPELWQVLSIINHIPTIDAVEVVRCKDCKHWVIDDYWNGNPDQVRACRFAGWMCGANGYCLYGERKTNAEVES